LVGRGVGGSRFFLPDNVLTHIVSLER